MQKQSRNLLIYGAILLLVGLASVLYHGGTGAFGWNPDGKTGLMICGSLGVVVMVIGGLVKAGNRGALWAALVISFLLLAMGGNTLFKTLRDVPAAGTEVVMKKHAKGEEIGQLEGEGIAKFKAALFGIMGVVSLGTFMRTGLFLRGPARA